MKCSSLGRRLAFAFDQREEALGHLPVVARQLAPGEVERLHAVGAFVEHRHPRIADDLLHAPLGDVAVPAEHLLHGHRGLEALVGAVALDHRGEQADQRLGRGALVFALGAVRQVDLQRGPQHQRAEALGEGPGVHQHAAHVGMDDQRIGRAPCCPAPGPACARARRRRRSGRRARPARAPGCRTTGARRSS